LQSDNREIVTFAAKIDASLLKRIRLAPESGAIHLIPAEQVIEIKPFDKVAGVQDRKTIVMFPDEIQALVGAFTSTCFK